MMISKIFKITALAILLSAGTLKAQIQNFEWQNVQRQYLVRTPENYESLPVMFFLHGLGDNITRCDQEYNFTQVAADFGWMVVIPLALNEGYGTMWNAGLTASTTNDSGSEYFGYQLGLSVDEIIDYWKNTNGCSDEPTVDTLPDTHNDGLLFVRYVHPGNKELQHLKVIGGNHSWYRNANQHDIDYMQYIHDFFTGKISYDKVENTSTGSLNVYPNPTTGQIIIGNDKAGFIEVIDIQGNIIVQQQIAEGISTLDLNNFQDGIYFLKEGGRVEKIVLER